MLFALNAMPGGWAGDGNNGWLRDITEAQIGQLSDKASNELYRAWTNNNTNLFYAQKDEQGNYKDAKVVSQFRSLSSTYINIIGWKYFARGCNWGTFKDDDKLDIDVEYQKLLSLSQISSMDTLTIKYTYPLIRDTLINTDITSLSEANVNTLIYMLDDDDLKRQSSKVDWIWKLSNAQISKTFESGARRLVIAWRTYLGEEVWINKTTKNSQGVYNDPGLISKIHAFNQLYCINTGKEAAYLAFT
jgi:hypothetical protein